MSRTRLLSCKFSCFFLWDKDLHGEKNLHRRDTEAENMGWRGSWYGMAVFLIETIARSWWLIKAWGLSQPSIRWNEPSLWNLLAGNKRFNNLIQGHTTKIKFIGACGPLEESVTLFRLSRYDYKKIWNMQINLLLKISRYQGNDTLSGQPHGLENSLQSSEGSTMFTLLKGQVWFSLG